MNIKVISDTHIKFDENNEDRERRFRVEAFLNSLGEETDILILNGDTFDLWFDWQNTIIAGYFDFLRVLKRVVERGIRVILLAGNHDFWFNGFLEKSVGIEVYPDIFTIEDNQKKLLFTHGDKYTTNDFRYLVFRYLLRNNITKTIFKFVHPEISLNMGKRMSRSSRKRQDPPSVGEVKSMGLRNHAEKKIQQGYYVVAMGHAHKPEKIKLGDGYYINSGDWILHNSFIEIVNGEAKLKEFKQ